MKKIVAALLALAMVLPGFVAFGATDERVFTDRVENRFDGRTAAAELIQALNFSDVASGFWAQESIVRGGALNIVRGYGGGAYGPSNYVTNEEAIAFVIRMIGLESTALGAAANVQSAQTGLTGQWSDGYLNTAMTLNIITMAEYNQLMAAADGGGELSRTAPATRERVAYWLASGLNYLEPGSVDLTGVKPTIYSFNDFNAISVQYAAAVNAIADKGIMMGDTSSNFRPQSSLTRAEMAQIVSNMGDTYYRINNIVRKTGTVGGYRDVQMQSTGTYSAWRNYYIRTASGGIDVITYKSSPEVQSLSSTQDVVVYKNGQATGLLGLAEGDTIEYLIVMDEVELEEENLDEAAELNPFPETELGTCYYIEVKGSGVSDREVEGTLYQVNTETGTIYIQDIDYKTYTYNMMDGVYEEGDEKDENNNGYMIIDQARIAADSLPIGSTLKLNLKNDVVESIEYVGRQVLIEETRGIVIENNTDFGYITFIDKNGQEITKNYYVDLIRVEKTQYYQSSDDIGYYNQVYQDFRYDPREADIMQIEAGDIIFVRCDPQDPDIITELSASTNYVARYGRISQITYGEDLTRYLIEYENKQTSWFDAANSIFISKEGKPISSTGVQVGDWVKLLVNQAIIGPGYVMESVKEIAVEGNAHYISTILKGQVAGVDTMQKSLAVQNVQSLSKTGWVNYQSLQQYPLTSNDIEYYYEGERVSLDYVERFLKRTEGDVYIALENSASGERIKKITFRNGRDELLSPDTVITADGNGSFAMISNSGNIATDNGTIVTRNGRLVDGTNIMALDYTTVALNGGSKAAVVDISEAADTSSVMIGIGRILSVDEGKSFKVQSMSVLTGNAWIYTPVQREFTIDYTTLFMDDSGYYVDFESFLDYTEDSVVDKVYLIVYDGGKATHVVESPSPYPNTAVRGTIAQVNGDSVFIRNAQYLEETTGRWVDVSRVDASLWVNVAEGSIVAKGSSVVLPSKLVAGDTIRVFTNNIPDNVTSGTEIDGYIVLVEN